MSEANSQDRPWETFLPALPLRWLIWATVAAVSLAVAGYAVYLHVFSGQSSLSVPVRVTPATARPPDAAVNAAPPALPLPLRPRLCPPLLRQPPPPSRRPRRGIRKVRPPRRRVRQTNRLKSASPTARKSRRGWNGPRGVRPQRRRPRIRVNLIPMGFDGRRCMPCSTATRRSCLVARRPHLSRDFRARLGRQIRQIAADRQGRVPRADPDGGGDVEEPLRRVHAEGPRRSR